MTIDQEVFNREKLKSGCGQEVSIRSDTDKGRYELRLQCLARN